MVRRFSSGEEPLSLREAHRLLKLSNSDNTDGNTQNLTLNSSDNNTNDNLTKSDIQSAFLEAARRYHPDSQHRPNAKPSAERFRRCYEARSLLFAHHCGIIPRSHHGTGARSAHYYYNYRHRRSNNAGMMGRGFPFRTLKLLTPKQNIILRGSVFTVLAFGTMYDDWSRKGKRERIKLSS